MPAPVIRQFLGTIPAKGQAQSPFDTNVDAFLEWQALEFAPDLVAFGAFASATGAALVAANLPPLTGRALDAVRVNAAANGVEFADVTASGWALLDDANATAQRATLGISILEGSTTTGLELGRLGSGDRNSLVDFHAHGLPNANDYSARIFRLPGDNGRFDVINTGTGGVNIIPGAGGLLLNSVAIFASTAFTGTPTAPTAAAATNTTQIATTAMVQAAIAALEKQIGVGQTWQSFLASRAVLTSYQNTSGKPIQVAVGAQSTTDMPFQVSANNTTWLTVASLAGFGGVGDVKSSAIIVPNNWYYRVNLSGTLNYWAELR